MKSILLGLMLLVSTASFAKESHDLYNITDLGFSISISTDEKEYIKSNLEKKCKDKYGGNINMKTLTEGFFGNSIGAYATFVKCDVAI